MQLQGSVSSRSISGGIGLNLQRASSYTSVSVPPLKTAIKLGHDSESVFDPQPSKNLKGVASSNNFSFLDLPTEAADVSSTRSTDGSANNSALIASGSQTSLVTQGRSQLVGDVLGATLLSTIARLFAPAFVDSSGTFRYRFSLYCPLRKNAVPSGRTFRISSSAIKVLHLQGGGGGGLGGGGGGVGVAGGVPSVNSLIQFPPLMRSSSATPMVGLSAPIPLTMSFSSSSAFEKTPSTTPSFGPRSPTASMSNNSASGSGYTSAGSAGSGGSGAHSKLQFQVPNNNNSRPSKPVDDETNWSFLDALLVGDQLAGAQPLPESTRYSRVCFLLLPIHQIDIASSEANGDDVHDKCLSTINGFQRFWDTHISKFGTNTKSTDNCKVGIFSPFSPLLSKQANEKTNSTENVAAMVNGQFSSCDNSSLLTSQRIELDTLGPAPFEWAVLHYGSIYNPLRTFPITLQWIAASPVAIENFITETSRRARQNGFVIQQIAEYTRKAPPVYQSAPASVAELSNPTLAFGSSFGNCDNLSTTKNTSLYNQQQQQHQPISSHLTFSNRAKQLISLLRESGEEGLEGLDLLEDMVSSLSFLQLLANRPIFDSLPSFMLTAPIPLKLTDNSLDSVKAQTITLFEFALVNRLGFVQDKASNGSEVVSATSGAILSSATQTSTNLFSATVTLAQLKFNSSSSLINQQAEKRVALDTLFLHPSAINTKGWYRQYLHIQRSCCVRIHANGASWLPCETKNARYDDEFESTTKKLFEMVCSAASEASEGVDSL